MHRATIALFMTKGNETTNKAAEHYEVGSKETGDQKGGAQRKKRDCTWQICKIINWQRMVLSRCHVKP